jgi:hypothetical protein
MKLKKEDYSGKKWVFIIEFDDRELECIYDPKMDEADWNWGKSAGSINEMEKAKRFLVYEKIIPRLKATNTLT